MNGLERFHNGHKHIYCFVLGNGSDLAEIFFQRDSVQILHDNICSFIFLEAVKYFYNSGFVLEFSQSLRLLDELFQTVTELFALIAVENRYL